MLLHIAAIGKAPQSVRVLADHCNARATEHQPLFSGGFYNKQRGFEVSHKTNHLLLIDTDVFLFSNVCNLLTHIGEDSVSAAVDGCLPVITNTEWRKLYDGLDVPPPEYKLHPLDVSLDTFKTSSEPLDKFEFKVNFFEEEPLKLDII